MDIDLNGFTINGPGGSSERSAIFQESDYLNLRVRNGNIVNWGGEGTFAVEALGLGNVLEDLSVYHCVQGLRSGAQSTVRRCIVYGGASSAGTVRAIDAVARSTVSDCIVMDVGTGGLNTTGIHGGLDVAILDSVVLNVSGNFSGVGLYTDLGGDIQRSVARGIFGNLESHGIMSGSDGRIIACVASGVASPSAARGIRVGPRGMAVHALAAANSGGGIATSTNGFIVSSLAVSNSSWGFRANAGSRITDSFAVGNGGSGFLLTEHNANEISNNDATRNLIGFDVGGMDLVTGNAALRNSDTNFDTDGATRLGLVMVNPGLAFTTTNSWANFSITD